MQPRRVYYRRGPADCPLETFHIRNAPKTDGYFVRHWHSQMEIYLVEHGQLRFYSLTGETDASDGCIYLIPPEEVHGNYCTVPDTDYHSILFSPELVTVPEAHFFHRDFLKPLREGKLRFPRSIRPQDPAYEKLLFHLRTILDADKKAPDYKSTVFLGTMGFCLALMPLCRVMAEDEINPLAGIRGNNVVHVCQQYLGTHYGEAITLSILAERVHMHPNYLCKLFKDYTGQTIFEYLTSIRISFATQFMRNSSKTIPQIAEQCGFNSMSFFTKKFKLHTGLTPHAYYKLYKNR